MQEIVEKKNCFQPKWKAQYPSCGIKDVLLHCWQLGMSIVGNSKYFTRVCMTLRSTEQTCTHWNRGQMKAAKRSKGISLWAKMINLEAHNIIHTLVFGFVRESSGLHSATSLLSLYKWREGQHKHTQLTGKNNEHVAHTQGDTVSPLNPEMAGKMLVL